MGLAKHVSKWSKDPSTKVGAVIADGKRFVSLGFNGFPAGVSDEDWRYENRDKKYLFVTHSEINAILFAKRSLDGFTIYTYPFQPCSVCSGAIIQAGIKRVVAPKCPKKIWERWSESLKISVKMFEEADVELDLVSYK